MHILLANDDGIHSPGLRLLAQALHGTGRQVTVVAPDRERSAVGHGITLRELRPGTIKVSLRTGPRVNATEVCARLGGGGHRAAAGATVSGTMDEVKAAVLRAVEEVVSA